MGEAWLDGGEIQFAGELQSARDILVHQGIRLADHCDVCMRDLRRDEVVQVSADPDTGDVELTCSHCLDGRTLHSVD